MNAPMRDDMDRGYARSAILRTNRSGFYPMHGSVIDLPYTPPSTGWLPSSR